MVDRDQKRVISFCAQSGKIGCYLALMAYYNRQNDIAVLPAFDEDTYRLILSTMMIVERPRILLIGYGTAGKRAKEIIDQFGFVCDIWTSKTPQDRSLIFDYDILIHAIRLPDDPSILIEPFLTLSELSSTDHRLSVICDITCDMGNPRNTLPIYTSYTTATDPIRRIEGNMDLIAINNLPSMEPHVSSTQFSAILSNYLPELPTMKYTHEINTNALSLYNSNIVFNRFKSI
jgi:saccharopine dehydrogenase (NAD+, L-lysine-forming)